MENYIYLCANSVKETLKDKSCDYIRRKGNSKIG